MVLLRSEKLGQRLADARGRLAVSANALAKAAGLHHKTVQDIEQGLRSPTVETVERLADALQVSPAWLAFGIGDSHDRSRRTTGNA